MTVKGEIHMYLVMDMGTTNTELYLCSEGKVVERVKGSFGASFGKKNGHSALCDSAKALIDSLISKCGIGESDIEKIVAVGMAGSEFGLFELPHIALPTDLLALAENARFEKIDGINIPFLFIPGVKKMKENEAVDVMRGEETEAIGLVSSLSLSEACVLVLPGTHNKIMSISDEGEILDFHTTFSGELLDSIVTNTILAGQVSHKFEIADSEVLKGASYAKENGLNAALFHIRVMAKNKIGIDELSSFLYGAVIGEDVDLIKRIAQGKKIYVGGRRTLRYIYSLLLGEENAVFLSDEEASDAMVNGSMLIKRIYDACTKRKAIIEAIEKEKVIAIVRGAEKESCVEAMKAIYEGGIRLAEITFDRSGKKTPQETADIVRMLVEALGDKMYIGVGTVTRKEELIAAFEAGASYIISPNCDTEIISLTRKLGLVSIPAAYTATEIAAAMNSGADFVKLFPANQVSADYVKAICAPLSDAKLLAVGGVNADNAKDFLNMGFCGIGVGSNLYNNKLIKEKNFDALRELARKYSEAVKSE